MKKTGLLLAIPVLFTAMAFKAPNETLSLKTGTYGICFLDEAPRTTLKTELVINDDFTFHYFDNSNPNKIIDLKGKWTQKGNIIALTDYHSEFAINNKWTIDTNEACLKSRKGLNFTRLCHIKSCK